MCAFLQLKSSKKLILLYMNNPNNIFVPNGSPDRFTGGYPRIPTHETRSFHDIPVDKTIARRLGALDEAIKSIYLIIAMIIAMIVIAYVTKWSKPSDMGYK